MYAGNTTEITIRAGGIIIKWADYAIYSLLQEMREELTEYQTVTDWKTKKTVRSVKAEYFIDDYEHKEMRFHSEYTEQVLDVLRLHQLFKQFKITIETPQQGRYEEITAISGKTPRGRQDEYIEFIADRSKHIRILPAFMGVGKTCCSLFSWTQLNTKVALIIPPSLVDNWIRAAKSFLTIKDEEILYVSGSKGLDSYMANLEEGINPWKVVIFSLNTMQSYITKYKEKDYLYTPDELFVKGEFGVKCVDEAHRCMHFHMLLDMYSNIATHQFLTATLMKEDKFLSGLENTLFNMDNRCEVDPPTKHVTLHSYGYRFNKRAPPHLGAMGYQHSKLETQIFKRKGMLKQYLLMLSRILYQDFVKSRKEGDRALVYFGTVNMVTTYAKALKKLLPDLKIVTYLAGDSEEKFEGADIIVSTTKKAGTGTDIPDLTYVLQTIPISSIGENYQNVGRLRQINGRKTTFSYIWSASIPKHLEYHRKRQKDLKPLICDSINTMLNFVIA